MFSPEHLSPKQLLSVKDYLEEQKELKTLFDLAGQVMEPAGQVMEPAGQVMEPALVVLEEGPPAPQLRKHQLETRWIRNLRQDTVRQATTIKLSITGKLAAHAAAGAGCNRAAQAAARQRTVPSAPPPYEHPVPSAPSLYEHLVSSVPAHSPTSYKQ